MYAHHAWVDEYYPTKRQKGRLRREAHKGYPDPMVGAGSTIFAKLD
jgi:hypothetical protein